MPKKAKRVSGSAITDLVVRSSLIVFSVLLALFLDGIREQQKVTSNLTTAYRNIRIELESNRDTLTSLVEYHHQSIVVLDRLLQGRERAIITDPLSQSLPKGLNSPALQSAAWNTLQSTGLMTDLKFDDVYPFTKLYASQKAGVERVSTEIRDFLSQPQLFENQGNAARLKTLRLLLNDLYELERRLLNETNTVLNAGQNWRYLE
ncbi:MAG TPA: hypothetical protein PK228_20795 [Saprospiraceae bacterium]|nr:hypothetical protein [Saprospiraceae bacterium]